MIDRLQGRLVAKSPTAASVDVGGVGLAVRLPLSTYETLPPDLMRQREAFLADVARRKGGG